MKKILTIAIMMAAAQAHAGTAAMETLRNSAGPAAAGFPAPAVPAAEAAAQGTQVMKLFKKGPAILAEVETSESLQYIAAFRADGPVENLPYIDVSMQVRYTKGGQLAWAEQKVRAMWTKNGFMAPPVNVSWLVPDTRRIVGVQLTYQLDPTHALAYIIQTSSEDHGVLLADEPGGTGIAPDLIAKLKAYLAR